MTTLLITGARGQLGSDLLAAAATAGIAATGVTSADLDITDIAVVRRAVSGLAESADGQQPVVINAAAYTAVDAAETDSDAAYAVNEGGARNLAEAAADYGARLIHISTDYVFPGDATSPYQVGDPTGPTSVYGASKLAGEHSVLTALPTANVVRTSWVYGAGGKNFVKTMAALQSSHPSITVVDDQRGSPTWTGDLAAGLIALAQADVGGGILHATGSGETTWCGLARAVFEELGADPERVQPITTDEFPRPTPRPAYSVLSADAWNAAGLPVLRPWREALAMAFAADRSAYLMAG
ncbi:MAG: dTDP-4-dehydrorhamnose reductase [Nakamurella sp.]